MGSKVLKTGIAGLGRSGWGIHCAMLKTIPEKYQIVSVFDPSEERRCEAVAAFDCKAFDNYDAMLADPELDLIVVATPNKFHAEHTIKALKAGKNVVCEKPMATNLPDAEAMIAAVEKSDKKLTIFQNQRYAKDFLAIQRVIASGVLGRIVEIKIAYHSMTRRGDWQSLKKNDGGQLNNTMPHPLDQALVLFGDSMPEVFCLRDVTLTLGDADDFNKLILYGKDAPCIEIEVSPACPFPQQKWTIMGTRGGLTGNATSLNWKYFLPEDLPERKVVDGPAPGRAYECEALPLREDSWSAENDQNPGNIGFYLDLYESLVDDKDVVITPAQILRQMQVLEKCRKMAPV